MYGRRDLRKLFNMRPHHIWTQCTIHSDTHHRKVRYRMPKTPRQLVLKTNVAPAGSNVPETITGTRLPDSSKYRAMPNRHAFRLSVSITVSGKRISTPPSTNAGHLSMIGSLHFLKCDSAISRIFNLGGDRSLLGRWSDRSCNKPRLVRSPFSVNSSAARRGISDRRKIDLANDFIGEVKIRQTNRTGG